jgi:hypothetical protein
VLLNSLLTWPPARTVRVLLAVACVAGANAGASARDPAATVVIWNSDIGAAPITFEPLQGHRTVVDDPSATGRIALWTKGDSVTRFDSIAVTPFPAAKERY